MRFYGLGAIGLQFRISEESKALPVASIRNKMHEPLSHENRVVGC
jgi:hypothetical protein